VRHWVVRTHVDVVKDIIVPSLDAGELRQGWAYRDDQSLDIIGLEFPRFGGHGLIRRGHSLLG
jgi:hypothetical protein